MKKIIALILTAAIASSAVLTVPAWAAQVENIQSLIEIELEDEAPQVPDSVEVSMTNELLGTSIAKVIVRKGVKKIKKSVKKTAKERSERKAVKGTGSANRMFPGKRLGTVRIVTYNVGTFTKSGYNKVGMVADMLQEMKADAAAVQEVDNCTARTASVNQIAQLAEATGDWDWYFTPAIEPYQGGAYGIGIVSKGKLHPIDKWGIQLEKGKGSETRALSVVEYKKFVLACTHLDHKNDNAQLNQAKAVTQALISRYGTSNKVVILCGDFNAKPNSKTIKEMRKNWTLISSQGETYSSSSPKDCIDYIMVLNNGSSYNLRHSFVARNFNKGNVKEASDHLPSWVDIKPKR